MPQVNLDITGVKRSLPREPRAGHQNRRLNVQLHSQKIIWQSLS